MDPNSYVSFIEIQKYPGESEFFIWNSGISRAGVFGFKKPGSRLFLQKLTLKFGADLNSAEFWLD